MTAPLFLVLITDIEVWSLLIEDQLQDIRLRFICGFYLSAVK